jgi:hypothetical protein
MAPILPLDFKFISFFIGSSSSISIPSPIPTSNVSQHKSMIGFSSSSFDPAEPSNSYVVEPLFKKPRKSYNKSKVFQDT